MLSYFYDPSIFIFRWSSNFMEQVVLEREHGGEDESEFEKKNNNYETSLEH